MLLLFYVAILVPYRICFDDDVVTYGKAFFLDVLVDMYFIVVRRQACNCMHTSQIAADLVSPALYSAFRTSFSTSEVIHAPHFANRAPNPLLFPGLTPSDHAAAYYDTHGELKYQTEVIAAHYARTWFGAALAHAATHPNPRSPAGSCDGVDNFPCLTSMPVQADHRYSRVPAGELRPPVYGEPVRCVVLIRMACCGVNRHSSSWT